MTSGEPEHIKTKVLVIDDDVNFCKMLERGFTLDGSFEPMIFKNAFRAGAVLDKFKPEVILLDIHIGSLDGREVCKFLRLDTELRHTKIMALSGSHAQEEIMGEGDSEFDGFLPKPFKFRELKELIREVLNRETDSL